MKDFTYRTTTLLLDHPFELTFIGKTNPKPFLFLFRKTWEQIPSEAQKKILGFWFSRAVESDKGPIHVRFELSNFWNNEAIYAQIKEGGRKACFRESLFAVMPESVGLWIVAHELAHVFNRSLSERWYDKYLLDAPDIYYEENERAADQLANSWGFDRSQLNFLEIVSEVKSISMKEAFIQSPRYFPGG